MPALSYATKPGKATLWGFLDGKNYLLQNRLLL